MSKDVSLKALFKEYGGSLVSVGAGSFLTTLSAMPFVSGAVPVASGFLGIAAIPAAAGLSIVAMAAFAIRDRYYYNAPTCG